MIILSVGAEKIIEKYIKIIKEKFEQPIYVEFGVAYGGMIEFIAKQLLDCGGIVYGLDTFDGHPKHLADKFSRNHTCMDDNYKQYGNKYTYYDIMSELEKQNINNVVLIKGLIDKNSLNCIKHVHCFYLDLDIEYSMNVAWNLVQQKIVKNGYVILHDCLNRSSILYN